MRKFFLQKLILFMATILSRPLLFFYRSTLTIRLKNPQHVRALRKSGQNFIFAFWHENMILPLLIHRDQGMTVLVSQHFDGEVIARLLRVFGTKTIRGSSTRGGKTAYLQMKRKMERERFEMVFTPDGPTGPRREAKLGAVRLASQTGVPILAAGIAASKYYRMNSWDRLLLIKPLAECVLYYGEPRTIPAGIDEPHLIMEAEKLSVWLNELDREAENCLFS